MKSLTLFLSKEKSLSWIILVAAVIRLLFVFIGGRFYYGHPDYFIQGDTTSWFDAFINLVERGTFTANAKIEAAKFFRPPGYSFLFGIFYLLSFKNYVLAWKLLAAAQVVMDVACVYLIAKISESVMVNSTPEKRNFFSNLSALLYGLYPSAIVFMPLLQAESSSIFFLLLGVRFAFKSFSARNLFLSGTFAGIATLIRLQCAFSLPFLLLGVIYHHAKKNQERLRVAALFCFGVGVTYGLWPARNLLFQNRILFSQDIRIGGLWADDYIAFLDFSHSISSDYTPYYLAILKKEKIPWPASAYIDPEDSLLLDSVGRMCQTCSNSFEHWRHGEGMIPEVIIHHPACDSQIISIFNSLTEKQKTKNTFHYWITIPLMNLKKCFFKLSLQGNKPFVLKLFGSLLFMFRSLLVVLGLVGIFIAIKKKFIKREFLLFALGYMMSWYLYISFIHRNIEMRYLLHTDIIMLIPAAFAIMILFFNKYLKAYE